MGRESRDAVIHHGSEPRWNPVSAKGTASVSADSQAPIDINKITAQSGRSIRNAAITRSRNGQVIQLKLDKPKLTSIGAEGLTWTVVVGDIMLEPTQPVSLLRLMPPGGRARRAPGW